MALLETVLVAFWTMLPAYVPNNAAVLFGGGAPIDGGRTWRGDRLLGDGKTWRGTAGGILAGALLAVVLNALNSSIATPLDADLPAFPLPAILALPTGALLGDIVASFIKRRSGRERGASFPLLDQLDFVVLALALTAIAAPEWFAETFTLGVIVVVLVLTPILHVGTNVVAYWLGLKDEPW